MENKNLTILFTDIKGFTPRTSSQSRSSTMDMIREHRNLLGPVIESRGGKIIKTIGDAFMVSFESPTDAVLAGMALQKTLHDHNAALPESDRVEIRVAVNTGECSVEEGDVYGEAVNIAARIEGIAEANEIYFTEATYLAMNKSEVPSAEIGYRMLKGIPEKIKVYRVLREGETRPARAAATSSAAPLSAAPAGFFRRLGAFAVDVLIVHLAAAILLAGAAGKIEKQRGLLREQAKQSGFETQAAIPDAHPPANDSAKLNQRAAKLKKGRELLANIFLLIYATVALGWKGKTLGKHLFKLRVVGPDGNRPSYGRAFRRTLLYWLSALPFFIGFLRAAFDPDKRTWHDKISDTSVIC